MDTISLNNVPPGAALEILPEACFVIQRLNPWGPDRFLAVYDDKLVTLISISPAEAEKGIVHPISHRDPEELARMLQERGHCTTISR